MLDGRCVDAAAEAIISVVDEDRKGRRPVGPKQGGYYTLEGAVAAVIYKNLGESFENVLRRAINAAREEEIGMRLGHIDLRDLADYDPDLPEIEENMPRSRVEELEELLGNAMEELKELREHHCEFGEKDYCVTCGADGRA